MADPLTVAALVGGGLNAASNLIPTAGSSNSSGFGFANTGTNSTQTTNQRSGSNILGTSGGTSQYVIPGARAGYEEILSGLYGGYGNLANTLNQWSNGLQGTLGQGYGNLSSEIDRRNAAAQALAAQGYGNLAGAVGQQVDVLNRSMRGQTNREAGQLAQGYGGLAGELDRRNAALRGETMGGYADLLRSAMSETDRLGTTERQRIADQYAQATASGKQSLMSRGLGNTTVQDSLDRGLLADRSRAENDLAERVQSQRLGVLNAFGNPLVQAGERLGTQGIGQYAGTIGQQLGAQQAYGQQALAGQQALGLYGLGQQASLGAQGLGAQLSQANQGIGQYLGTVGQQLAVQQALGQGQLGMEAGVIGQQLGTQQSLGQAYLDLLARQGVQTTSGQTTTGQNNWQDQWEGLNVQQAVARGNQDTGQTSKRNILFGG
jgi:hypothetical protein